MLKIALAAALLAAPASADVATIQGCDFTQGRIGQVVIHCDIENHSDRAIASVVLRAIVKSPDREVPWIEIGNPTYKRHATIPGGIEPDETAGVFISLESLPDRAEGLPLEVHFLEAQFMDVNGDRIGETIGRDAANPLDAVNDALGGALTP